MSLGAGDPEGEGPGFASGSDSSFGGRGDLPPHNRPWVTGGETGSEGRGGGP